MNLLAQLLGISSSLAAVPQSFGKLTDEEKSKVNANIGNLNLADPAVVTNEILWRLAVIKKMTALSTNEIASVDPKLLPKLPHDGWSGTGFLVSVIDRRIPLAPGDKGPRGFIYLVTNRHVAEPGVEKGKPCQMTEQFIMLNHKPDKAHDQAYAEVTSIGRLLHWNFGDDNSVDLAVAPIGIPDKDYDYAVVADTDLVTDEQVKNRSVVEGDSVLFSGLFTQSFAEAHTLEPIVRSGIIAMIPNGPLETVLNKQKGRLYLTEAHVFGGNSGSPMFVDPSRFANVISGPNYKLLGVVSGEMFENNDLTLSATTTFSGNIGANSGVSLVVPAAELLKILKSSALQTGRDAVIAKLRLVADTGQPSKNQ